jgi:hypothetical protein
MKKGVCAQRSPIRWPNYFDFPELIIPSRENPKLGVRKPRAFLTPSGRKS